MLELASIELSDNEIAARLNLSPRSIRFQLEGIFRMLGVRNRSEAIAIWVDSKPGEGCIFKFTIPMKPVQEAKL